MDIRLYGKCYHHAQTDKMVDILVTHGWLFGIIGVLAGTDKERVEWEVVATSPINVVFSAKHNKRATAVVSVLRQISDKFQTDYRKVLKNDKD